MRSLPLPALRGQALESTAPSSCRSSNFEDASEPASESTTVGPESEDSESDAMNDGSSMSQHGRPRPHGMPVMARGLRGRTVYGNAAVATELLPSDGHPQAVTLQGAVQVGPLLRA